MEEIERRILFTWFLTIIGFVVVGIAAHLISSSFGLPMWFHGLTGACIGLIFFHLYLFDAFWEDRYLVMSIGILLAVGFILWGVFASAMPELIAGVISLVTALLVIGTAAWFNMVGWKTEDVERKYRYVHFIGLIAGIVILLVVVAAISV